MIKILLLFRALFLIIFIPVHTLVYSILVITMLVLHFPSSYVGWIIRLWSRTIVLLSGIHIQIHGKENRPQDRGFVHLFTHSSFLDIPVLVCSSSRFFSFGAKSSLFKVPFFGYALTLLGILPITRKDRQKVIQVYSQAEKRLANGEVFVLSPEGGRRGSDEIREFKSGPFIFAINAKAPIVPIVLCGVDHCLKKGSILINTDKWVRKVGVHILPPVEVSGLNIEDTKDLKEKVHRQISKEFESMKKLYL